MDSIPAQKGDKDENLITDDSGISLSSRSIVNSDASVKELGTIHMDATTKDSKRKCLEDEGKLERIKLNSYLHRYFALKNKIEILLDMVDLRRRTLISDCVKNRLSEAICKQRAIDNGIERKHIDVRNGAKKEMLAFDAHKSPGNCRKKEAKTSSFLHDDKGRNSDMLSDLKFEHDTDTLGMLSFQMQRLVQDNICLKTKLDAYKGLYKESREKYLEYQNETERTLAILGKYVMTSRDIKVECDNLREVVQEMRLEKELSMDRLRNYRCSVEKLKKQLEEEAERGNKLEEKANELTQILNKKIEDSIKNTIA